MTRGSSIRLYCSALAVGVLLTTALGQTSATAGKVKVRELTIEQQNAAGVLDSLTDQAKSVSDTAMRIRVEARLADALWEHDRERSKRLFRHAFAEIDDLNESLIDPTAAPVGARSELYVELFASLYRTDPEFANEMARGLDDDPDLFDGDGLPFENLSDRSATLLKVATSVAPRNPTLAAELGRQSLQMGVPMEFGALLDALSESAPPVADTLAGDAIQTALQYGSSPIDLWGVGSFLFPELENGPSSVASGGGAADTKRRFLEAAYAVTGRYVSTLSDHTIAPAPGDAVDPASVFTGQGLMVSYSLARQIAPLFDAYDPERSAAFRVLVGQIEGSAPSDVRDRVRPPSSSVESPDDLASRAAESGDASVRVSLYARAAFVAMQRDGYAAAKGYVSKIDDDDARARVLGPLAREAVSIAIRDKRYDDARVAASDIPNLDDRAASYCDIARALASEQRKPAALDLLDDAVSLVTKEGAVITEAKARGLVRIANAYAPLDPLRGFDVVSTAVASVNKSLGLVDSATKDRNPGTMYRLSAYDLSAALEALAQDDYFRALSLAQSIDNRPLSILGQLAVVRGALRPAMVPLVERRAAPTKKAAAPKAGATKTPPAKTRRLPKQPAQ